MDQFFLIKKKLFYHFFHWYQGWFHWLLVFIHDTNSCWWCWFHKCFDIENFQILFYWSKNTTKSVWTKLCKNDASEVHSKDFSCHVDKEVRSIKKTFHVILIMWYTLPPCTSKTKKAVSLNLQIKGFYFLKCWLACWHTGLFV